MRRAGVGRSLSRATVVMTFFAGASAAFIAVLAGLLLADTAGAGPGRVALAPSGDAWVVSRAGDGATYGDVALPSGCELARVNGGPVEMTDPVSTGDRVELQCVYAAAGSPRLPQEIFWRDDE